MKSKYRPFILSFLITLPMVITMSLVAIATTSGFITGWFSVWLKSAFVMLPVAYVCVIIFSPLARKLLDRIKWVD